MNEVVVFRPEEPAVGPQQVPALVGISRQSVGAQGLALALTTFPPGASTTAHLHRGYETAITAALGPAESRGFIEAGFEVRERLHLLAHDLHDVPPVPPSELRRGRRADRPAALVVDGRSFDAFWRLDDSGFEEALGATPSSRFRVASRGDGVVGYAISGRAGSRGFLQRLAIDPGHQRRGLGRTLALDSLRWLKRRGVDRAMVNTQEHNDGALSLYQHLGFRLQPGGLAVLQITLT